MEVSSSLSPPLVLCFFPPISLLVVVFTDWGRINGAGNANPTKRRRDAVSAPVPAQSQGSVMPAQVQENVMAAQVQGSVMAAQVQGSVTAAPARMGLPVPSTIATGLALAFDGQNRRSSFSEELSALISQQQVEIGQFLLAQVAADLSHLSHPLISSSDILVIWVLLLVRQEEQLRRALAESQQRLLNAVAESIDRRLTEKEAEVDYEKRRSTELEERLALLRSQSMAWQTRAIAGQAAVSSLHAQIRQVVLRPPVDELTGESPSPLPDAESANMESGPTGPAGPAVRSAPARPCLRCRQRPASILVLPCRHLCLCSDCASPGAGEGCPACGCLRAGSVEVFFS
ncbi:putative E3 ubiquitin-protein ligase LUL3 [Apostasia shenzhenica]|uniref:Putative E3 ubiquitin-protein ligase LUL3 n=1 Tax=Apostasia shenzhenica TaxID=1088818 RepID=A0A2I0ATK7_9ASPA|nr:putative E3 ubiquitin-protein ligase LUL3 [Apostasia shenzhenica]